MFYLVIKDLTIKNTTSQITCLQPHICSLGLWYYPKPATVIIMLLLCYTQTVRANRDEDFLPHRRKRDKPQGLNKTSIRWEIRLHPPLTQLGLICRGVWYEMAYQCQLGISQCVNLYRCSCASDWCSLGSLAVGARCQAREFSHRMDGDSEWVLGWDGF